MTTTKQNGVDHKSAANGARVKANPVPAVGEILRMVRGPRRDGPDGPVLSELWKPEPEV